MSWYSINAKKAAPRADGKTVTTAEVFIYGDIGESWYGDSVAAASFVKEFAALDADEITVRINSYGGSVSDGVAIYNAIKRHRASVTVAIDGVAVSIASLIAMAGDRVEMAENALLMIHAPWGYASGNSADMREMAEVLDKYAQAMASSYAGKTGKPMEDILALLTDGEDHWYTAAEAEAEGFVDTVTAALAIAASGDLAAARARFNRTSPVAAAAGALAASAAQPKQENLMSQITPAAAPQPATPNEAEIKAAALAADQTRRAGIRGAFAKFEGRDGVAALLKQCEDDHNMTVEAAGLKLLDFLGANATPIAGNHVVTVEDETDKHRRASVDALLTRAGVATGEARASASNPFRGFKMLDFARASLDRAGISHKGMDQMQIVAAAFTQGTSDFPVLLENALHKTLQTAYAAAADTWSTFCHIGSVSDFRAHSRYRLGSLGNLDALTELGEYKNKAIPDGEKGSITAGTKGNIINLSRQAMINDDLGAFLGLAQMLGRAARRTIEVDVYKLLAENAGLGPVMDDGKTLIHADHGNLGAGSAIGVAGIEADRVLMAQQKDVSGVDYLDLRPHCLLVPTSLGGTARVINDAQYDPDTANKLQMPNKVRGLFANLVDTPRLTGTRRYLFADHMEAPVIEVAFLDGVQEPYLELQNGFDVDGGRYKVRLDFGVAAIDYRGIVSNAGQ